MCLGRKITPKTKCDLLNRIMKEMMGFKSPVYFKFSLVLKYFYILHSINIHALDFE